MERLQAATTKRRLLPCVNKCTAGVCYPSIGCHLDLHPAACPAAACNPICPAQDKLQALIDRAAFMPCFLTGASLEVRVAADMVEGRAEAVAAVLQPRDTSSCVPASSQHLLTPMLANALINSMSVK